ncbi:eukaryotic translation initiation factor 3 subunit C-like [Limulus polyphemus]|uniref:Eukaryotic translation initiation factor 3 subunit C n=1 Tax=Limulus polyphemus TaxID=6850 RepID=A0ABM1BB06_LIMPO|nr:eukaryotic translation initiation factor 3 subunit C-like [Limulus polyphemus]
MSRFFAVSDSESESSSSEEEQVQQKAPVISSAFTFSDDEEETKRVVRSAREKRYEELTDIIKQLRNHKKIKDFTKMLTGFESLTKAFQKARPVIDKEEDGITPKFYIRCLVEIEDFICECWEDRDGRKNMSKNNSKSLATLRQKLRKYNKDFDTELATYRENPEVEEEKDEQEESESDDDDEAEDFLKKPAASEFKEEPKSKFIAGSDDEEESDDDSFDWGGSSESESSLSSDDEKYGGNLAAKFLKKTTDKDEQKEKKREKKRDKEKKEKKKDDGEGEWEEVKGGVPLIEEKPKMFAKDAEINHQLVVKKLNEILAARGKKGTDRNEQIEMLHELLSISNANNLGPAMEVKIMFALITAIFDYNPNIATCMRSEIWQKCLEHLSLLLDLLVQNPDVTMGEHIPEESELLVTPPYRVRGCVLTLIDRMDEEFTKMLQACDAHSPEYLERLKDETAVYNIIEKYKNYLEGRGSNSELCFIYLRMIDHIYYKILYNRAMVQLGLCAFRHGNIRDAHNALLDIQSGGRAKELLAQGLLPQRQHERTAEQEKIEKRRQMPFHKHINLELLECVYLVSAMLLEIPYMAAHELDGRKRMISKSFHHQLRNSERQPLVGPPESMREHVVAASKAMRVGNWKQCKNYIINEKMNAKVWDLFHKADKVREMICQKIQEESLRSYLFTYSNVYDSISMNILSEMFELEKSIVHSIISKMIINEELMASLDEPTQTVVMHRTEPSRIQALSLQLADKITNLVEQNERFWETKQGSFFGRNIGQQGYRDSGYQKTGYSQQDRNWGRRNAQRN